MKFATIRRYWEIPLILSVTALALLVPMQMAFGIRYSGHLFEWNIVVTLVFLIDLLFSFDEFRQHHISPKLNRGKWLAYDIIATLPLGLITGIPALGLIRLVKLAKLLRTFRDWRTRNFRYMDHFKLSYTIYWMFLIIFWIACGWYWMRGATVNQSETDAFVDAIYWSITTLGTVGYGDITPNTINEKLFAIFTMVLGFAFFGYLIGQIASILSKTDPARARYLANLSRLSEISGHHNMPRHLQERIYEYYTYEWKKRHGNYDSAFLENLPSGLRKEVSRFLKNDVLENVPLFQGANHQFIEEISLRLRSSLLTPQEFVFKSGEVGDRMYFIVHGSVEILLPTGEVIAELGNGDFFGEIALFLEQPRNATVRTNSYCDLYFLTKPDFDYVLKRFPNVSEEIRAKVMDRVEANTAKSNLSGV